MLPRTIPTILLSLLVTVTSTTAALDEQDVSAPLETLSSLATTDIISAASSLPGATFESATATAPASASVASFTALTSATPGGPINTFTSSVGSISADTTITDIQPSKPTGTFTAGSATGSSVSASASSSAAASQGVAAACDASSGSKVALVIALGAGLLGWVGL